MATETVELHEAQLRLPELISRVITGEEIILTDGTTPLVRLVPMTPMSSGRVAGLHAGAITMQDDFDAPLPEEFWTATP